MRICKMDKTEQVWGRGAPTGSLAVYAGAAGASLGDATSSPQATNSYASAGGTPSFISSGGSNSQGSNASYDASGQGSYPSPNPTFTVTPTSSTPDGTPQQAPAQTNPCAPGLVPIGQTINSSTFGGTGTLGFTGPIPSGNVTFSGNTGNSTIQCGPPPATPRSDSDGDGSSTTTMASNSYSDGGGGDGGGGYSGGGDSGGGDSGGGSGGGGGGD